MLGDLFAVLIQAAVSTFLWGDLFMPTAALLPASKVHLRGFSSKSYQEECNQSFFGHLTHNGTMHMHAQLFIGVGVFLEYVLVSKILHCSY